MWYVSRSIIWLAFGHARLRSRCCCRFGGLCGAVHGSFRTWSRRKVTLRTSAWALCRASAGRAEGTPNCSWCRVEVRRTTRACTLTSVPLESASCTWDAVKGASINSVWTCWTSRALQRTLRRIRKTACALETNIGSYQIIIIPLGT